MKSIIKKFFLISAVVLSLVAAQAVWAGEGPDCTTSVSGKVSEVLIDDNAIIVDTGETFETVYGIPLPWIDINVGDEVVINAHECPDSGKLMACYLTINGGDIIDLRPRGLEKSGGKL